MTHDEIRAIVLQALASVAPELDLAAIDPQVSLRDQYDLDSVDFLNFVVAIHKQTGIDVPEADYAKLASLADCVAYLAGALGAAPRR